MNQTSETALNNDSNLNETSHTDLGWMKSIVSSVMETSWFKEAIISLSSLANTIWDTAVNAIYYTVKETYAKDNKVIEAINEKTANSLHLLGDKHINASIEAVIRKIDLWADPEHEHFNFHLAQRMSVLKELHNNNMLTDRDLIDAYKSMSEGEKNQFHSTLEQDAGAHVLAAAGAIAQQHDEV